VRLQTTEVRAFLEEDVAILAPAATPAIADDPIVFCIANCCNTVSFSSPALLVIDAIVVVRERGSLL